MRFNRYFAVRFELDSSIAVSLSDFGLLFSSQGVYPDLDVLTFNSASIYVDR